MVEVGNIVGSGLFSGQPTEADLIGPCHADNFTRGSTMLRARKLVQVPFRLLVVVNKQ